jgi:phospholipid-binding lipoprotein MlaA
MRRLRALLLALLAGGCATTNGDPRDPLEGLNRGVYRFNDAFDSAIMRPVATAYRDWVHDEIRSRVRNFFSNLSDPIISVHNLVQGKLEDSLNDAVRFVFNSTFGLLGLHDIASDMGYEKHNEDFGQTFGRWGAGTGAYLVLPLLGSSSVRDGLGTVLDFVADPVAQLDPTGARVGVTAVRFTQVRADLLDASRILEEAALDKYVFQRDAYFQRRRSLVYDGRPPRENLPDSQPPREDAR